MDRRGTINLKMIIEDRSSEYFRSVYTLVGYNHKKDKRNRHRTIIRGPNRYKRVYRLEIKITT